MEALTYRLRRVSSSVLVALALLLALPALGRASDADIKAAFLFNVIRYVTWPTAVTPKETITIGILGSGALASPLKNLRDKTVQGRRIQIRQVESLAELKGCQVLVLLPSERRSLSSLLIALRNEPVLTISDIEGFSHQGGMLAITVANNHPAFKVNLRAVRTAGLDMGSQLLKLAEVVIQ